MLAGCGEPAGSTEVGCAFGESHTLAESSGPGFDGIALAATGEGAWLVWSERAGAFARRLGAHGAPTSAARRLGPGCAGGVAAAMHDGALLVACLAPGDRDRGREGVLTLLRVGEREPVVLGRTGPVGATSRRPEVAAERGRVVVGWRDADVFVARARVAELGPSGLGEARALSSEGTLASAPSLAFVEGHLVAAWTESWFEDGRAVGHLLTRREEEPPLPSLRVGDVDVRTHLAVDARGAIATLRDARGRSTRHRAFAGRLDDALRLEARALRSPGRADADDAHPSTVPCGEHLFAIATRLSSRDVTMVTLRRLDASLEPREAEHQIYEYHARFPQAVAVCVEGRLLVAVGEQQSEVRAHPRLSTYELVCEPGRAHARTPGTEGQVLRKRAR